MISVYSWTDGRLAPGTHSHQVCDHWNHLVILGVFLLFSIFKLGLSAAFVSTVRNGYYGSKPTNRIISRLFKGSQLVLEPGYYLDSSGLVVAESVLSIIAATAQYVSITVINRIGELIASAQSRIPFLQKFMPGTQEQCRG